MATNDGRWFSRDDAEAWEVRDGGMLFQIGETWAVLDAGALLFHGEAKIITPAEALTWLTSRGFEVPDTLAKFADASRVKVKS